jgi:hypothetical protein
VEETANLVVSETFDYGDKRKELLHNFALMPDHLLLVFLTPTLAVLSLDSIPLRLKAVVAAHSNVKAEAMNRDVLSERRAKSPRELKLTRAREACLRSVAFSSGLPGPRKE